jgi:hypothetical protein
LLESACHAPQPADPVADAHAATNAETCAELHASSLCRTALYGGTFETGTGEHVPASPPPPSSPEPPPELLAPPSGWVTSLPLPASAKVPADELLQPLP